MPRRQPCEWYSELEKLCRWFASWYGAHWRRKVEAYRNEISSAQRGERALPHALIRRLRIHRARLEAASLADRGPTPEKKRAVQPDSQAA